MNMPIELFQILTTIVFLYIIFFYRLIRAYMRYRDSAADHFIDYYEKSTNAFDACMLILSAVILSCLIVLLPLFICRKL